MLTVKKKEVLSISDNIYIINCIIIIRYYNPVYI